MLKKEYMESFESIFKEQYDTIHRLETNKLRNVAKMFAHLLYTDSLPWSVSRWGQCLYFLSNPLLFSNLY